MKLTQPDKPTTAIPCLLVRSCVTVALVLATAWVAGCSSESGLDTERPATAADQFANIDNSPFATRTLGPRGALCYPVAAGATAEAYTAGLDRALAEGAVSTRDADAANVYVELLARHGLKRPGVVFRPSRRAMPVADGRPVFPSLDGATIRAAGDLTFVVQGFSASETQLLNGIIAKAYPLCKTYYGAPAFAHTVTVALQSDLSNMAEGIYDAGADTIRLAPLSDNDRNTEFALIRHMLHAFRDDAMLFYDAWEDGQVLAVTNLVMGKLHNDWDPSIERPEYNLNLYELQNAPELGSDAIWNTGFAGLIVPRLGCASGAWMKVLVEDPQALATFNTAYFAQFAGDTALAGDIPRLTALMAAAVPRVEGRGFWDWIRGQYALDTSLPVGQRFYVGMIPTFSAVALFVTHTVVGAGGAEKGQGGTVALEFWDYTREYSLFVQEGYEISIPASGGNAGLGEYSGSLYNVGGAQRITIDLELDSLVRHAVYPYNSRREDLDIDADPNGVNVYGAITGRDSGTVSISVNGATATEVELKQGAFRGHFGDGFIKPGTLTLTYTDPSEGQLTRTYNTGYFDYAIVAELGTRDTLAHTFSPTATGLQLVSFPGTPLESDEAAVFGIDREDVLLAMWQPDLAGDDKYRIYPSIPPLSPGRGYWLKSSEAVSVATEADFASGAEEYRVRLSPGWNLIGLPLTATVLPSNLKFDQGGAPVDFTTAIQNGWIRGIVYEFDGATGSYAESSALTGWAGYWIRCIASAGCNLVFFAGAESAAADARASAPTVADRLRASGAAVAELEARQGSAACPVILARLASAHDSADDAWDVEAPPPAPGGGLQAGVARDGGLLAVDLSAARDRVLAIGADPAGGPVRLFVRAGAVVVAGRTVPAGGEIALPTNASGWISVGVRLP